MSAIPQVSAIRRVVAFLEAPADGLFETVAAAGQSVLLATQLPLADGSPFAALPSDPDTAEGGASVDAARSALPLPIIQPTPRSSGDARWAGGVRAGQGVRLDSAEGKRVDAGKRTAVSANPQVSAIRRVVASLEAPTGGLLLETIATAGQSVLLAVQVPLAGGSPLAALPSAPDAAEDSPAVAAARSATPLPMEPFTPPVFSFRRASDPATVLLSAPAAPLAVVLRRAGTEPRDDLTSPAAPQPPPSGTEVPRRLKPAPHGLASRVPTESGWDPPGGLATTLQEVDRLAMAVLNAADSATYEWSPGGAAPGAAGMPRSAGVGRAAASPAAAAPRAASEPDPEWLASLVNDVLAEQARRHGVDLS